MLKKDNQNGAFRKKVKFAMVSSIAIKDKNLSLRAKGLYTMIQNYITLEDFIIYKNYLVSICGDGKSSFDRAWDELKSNGYLKQHLMQDDTGKIYYEYDLLDEPAELTEEEKKAFEQKEANRIARNKRKTEKQKQKKEPVVEVPPTDETIDGSSTHGSSIHGSSTPLIITEDIQTDLTNTDSSSSEDDEVLIAYESFKGSKITPSEQPLLLSLVTEHGKEKVLASIEVGVRKCKMPNFEYIKTTCVKGIHTSVSKQNNTNKSKFDNLGDNAHGWDLEDLENKAAEYMERSLYGGL